MLNKKGMFFWLEMLILVILLVVVFVSLPRSSDNFLNSKDIGDLENLGFNALRGLDNAKVLDTFTNDTNFTRSNFTALSVYIKNSLPGTVDVKLEYFNGTGCLAENGTFLARCGNFTRAGEITRAEYTMARIVNATTAHLYLGRLF